MEILEQEGMYFNLLDHSVLWELLEECYSYNLNVTEDTLNTVEICLN